MTSIPPSRLSSAASDTVTGTPPVPPVAEPTGAFLPSTFTTAVAETSIRTSPVASPVSQGTRGSAASMSTNSVAASAPSLVTACQGQRCTRRPNVDALVGGIVGGLVGLMTILLLLWCYTRRRHFRRQGWQDIFAFEKRGQTEMHDGVPVSVQNGGLNFGHESNSTHLSSYLSPEPLPLSSQSAPTPRETSDFSNDAHSLRQDYGLDPESPERAPYTESVRPLAADETTEHFLGRQLQQRKQELSRMVQEHQRSLADLRAVSDSEASLESAHLPNATVTTSSSHTTAALRGVLEQMEVMQDELRRLRTELSLLQDGPPPEYVSVRDDMGRDIFPAGL